MIRDRLNADLKDAMRAGEKLKTSTLRLVNAAIKSADIEARPSGKSPIEDTAIETVLAKMNKQRRDSVEQFTTGGRQDLAANEQAEIGIIEAYLPKQMDAGEVKAAVAMAVAATGAQTIKDMGKVMAQLKAEHAGKMDFGAVGAIVKGLLK